MEDTRKNVVSQMRAQLSRWTPRRLVPLAFATLGLAVFFVAHTRTDWRSSWRHQPPVAHEPAVQAMSARVAMQAAPATAARSTEDEGVHALPRARAPAQAPNRSLDPQEDAQAFLPSRCNVCCAPTKICKFVLLNS